MHLPTAIRPGLRIGARLAAGAAALALLAVLAVAACWTWRGGDAGVEAVLRLLRHGPTTVYDFRHYPARELQPGAPPAHFSRRAAAAPPMVAAADGRSVALADQLASTRTLALVVVVDDAIVYEHYAPGHGADAPSQYFSVTKTVLATLVGMAVDDGLIRSLGQPVTDFVPELAKRGFAQVTLGQLVDMTSALDYTENDNPFGLHPLLNYTPQVEAMVLGFRTRGDGPHPFRYKSGDTALLSLALRRALGDRSLTAYAQARLWSALGMEHRAQWSLDRPDGFEKAWCCLAGSARDLARIGRLYLARGMGPAGRVLSERWVEQSAPPAAVPRRYTRSWWPASPQGTDFMAVGKDGQYLYLEPSRRAIVVRLGETRGGLDNDHWARLFARLAAHPW